MPRTEQKHLSLPRDMWDKIYAIARNRRVYPSRIVEAMLIDPLKKKYEDLGLGKFNKNKANTFSEIGQIADRVGASNFAAKAIKVYQENVEFWDDQYKHGWIKKEVRDMEIHLAEMRMKESSGKQVKEDWKEYRVRKRIQENVKKAVVLYEHGFTKEKALEWLDERFKLAENKKRAEEIFGTLVKE